MQPNSVLQKKLYSDRKRRGDAVFIVESERIFAHRCVLAAISPKYDAQFYGGHADENEIEVPNASAAAFEDFIKFFYFGDIDLTPENIEEILYLANQSLVEKLINRCKLYLLTLLHTKNLCQIYKLSVLYTFKSIRRRCEERIVNNVPRLFAYNDFLECDHDTLRLILKTGLLCNEIDILNGCISWARALCKRKNLIETSATLRAQLGSAIDDIHFRSMSIDEFGKFNIKHQGFFTVQEIDEINAIIANGEQSSLGKFNQKCRVFLIDTHEDDNSD